MIPRYLTNELLNNLVQSFTELGNQRTCNKDQEKTVEGFRIVARNLSDFLMKYRNNRPKIERLSYELVPVVLHKSEKNDTISTIYGGVSFNCRLNENSSLKKQKIMENRQGIDVSSRRKTNVHNEKKSNECINDRPSHVIGRGAGPSGKPKLHFVQLNSRKDAQEAARKAGKGFVMIKRFKILIM